MEGLHESAFGLVLKKAYTGTASPWEDHGLRLSEWVGCASLKKNSIQCQLPPPSAIVSDKWSSSMTNNALSRVLLDTKMPQSQHEQEPRKGLSVQTGGTRKLGFSTCQQCNRKFRRQSDLNRHIRCVHEKIRPYGCPTCGLKFGLRNNLERHISVAHGRTRRYRCTHCSSTFASEKALFEHFQSLGDEFYHVHGPTGTPGGGTPSGSTCSMDS